MSIELTPPELGFRRPFTHEVSQVLRLRNPNSEPLAFKVKTTAPKQYCVRPNSGRIEPGKDVEVQVLLQAMKEDPPLDARCRDKFLVQSVVITAEKDGSNVSQIWANIEQTARSSIQEKKIRVNFLPADGSAGSPTGMSAINGASHLEDEPPAYSSPAQTSAVTPQRSVAGAQDSKSPFGGPSDSTPSRSALDTATAAIASTTGISEAELKRQLDEAKATITRLQSQATEGLRQRKTGAETGSSGKSTTIQTAPPAGGVPVQIVAALCLLCFLIAYLFF